MIVEALFVSVYLFISILNSGPNNISSSRSSSSTKRLPWADLPGAAVYHTSI